MRFIFLFGLALANLVMYQNCSAGFETLSSSSLAGSQTVPDADAAIGKSLYQANCAGCHGSIESSAKIGTNAFALTNALANVPNMKHLKFTELQIASIVLALTPAKDETLPPSAQLKYACASPYARGLTNPAIRRLSKLELQNTLGYVLGTSILNNANVADALERLPEDEVLKSTDDFSSIHPAEFAAALMTVANQAVALAVQTAAIRTSIFGACANTAPVTDACAASFVKNFGMKVYRRPLTSDEETRFKKIYTDAGGQLPGLNSALFVFIQSPPMSSHIEIGSGDQTGRARLSDYEVASRISYLTASVPPDAMLLTAAGRRGELQSLTEVKKHVSRLLNASNVDARQRISTFMKFYSGVTEIEDPSPAVGKARSIATTGLGAQMVRELGDYTDHIFWTATGDFTTLMTSRVSFPRSESLRLILGASGRVGTDNKPVEASPDHIGFIHRPAFLASPGERTTPILRGVHVRNHVLCDIIPLPPSDVVDEQIEELGNIENQTNRAKVTQLTGSQNCIGCHSQINPLGFPFEGYDQLGFTRKNETIYTDSGAVVANWPIDTSVQQPKLEASEGSGVSVRDSIELATAISKGSKARSCFAQKAFEFTRARKLNAASDGCALRESEVAAHRGTLKDVIIESIANEDIFWRKLN